MKSIAAGPLSASWVRQHPAKIGEMSGMASDPRAHMQGRNMNKIWTKHDPKMPQNKANSTVWGHIFVHMFALCVGVGVSNDAPTCLTLRNVMRRRMLCTEPLAPIPLKEP